MMACDNVLGARATGFLIFFVSLCPADRPGLAVCPRPTILTQLNNDSIATPLLLLCLLLYLHALPCRRRTSSCSSPDFDSKSRRAPPHSMYKSPSGNLRQFSSDSRDLRRIVEEGDAVVRSRHLPTARATIGVEEPVGSVPQKICPPS